MTGAGWEHDGVDTTSGPAGFSVHVAEVGVAGDGRADCSVVVSDRPATTAAVFTRSRFAGPSVELSRSTAAQDTRGVVVFSRNANVATGPEGAADAVEVRDLVGAAVGVRGEELLLGSTGVIGRRYPMDVTRRRLRAMAGNLPTSTWEELATAIMTTDTTAKLVRRRVGPAMLVGVAKGVGMMEPDMATLLAFFFTDAEVGREELDRTFRRVVATTFNALTIDTDTSTSDTAAVLANGAAGPVDPVALEEALYGAALELVRMISSDGEGATRALEVTVRGAGTVNRAKRVAKAVANSPLVKTMVHGADPNWGRVAMAVGKCQDELAIDPGSTSIGICGIALYPGLVTEARLKDVRAAMSRPDQATTIDVDLGLGPGEFTVYGCDLSPGYVQLNSSYTS